MVLMIRIFVLCLTLVHGSTLISQKSNQVPKLSLDKLQTWPKNAIGDKSRVALTAAHTGSDKLTAFLDDRSISKFISQDDSTSVNNDQYMLDDNDDESDKSVAPSAASSYSLRSQSPKEKGNSDGSDSESGKMTVYHSDRDRKKTIRRKNTPRPPPTNQYNKNINYQQIKPIEQELQQEHQQQQESNPSSSKRTKKTKKTGKDSSQCVSCLIL